MPGAASGLPFRLMQFNVEYGGALIDFDSVPAAIHAAGPDVVALEEAMGNTARIAEALGWAHHSARHHVVSKLPLIDPPEADGRYVFLELAPGLGVALANVHPIDEPYGPEKAAEGMAPDDLLRLEERVRLPEVRPALDALAPLVAAGFPTFLAGDFNAPSHLDWVPEAVGARPAVRSPVAWPVSRAIEAAGFFDSFRAVHPDPLAEPGLTWPAERRLLEGEWNPAPNDPHDRIDFIYAAGPARTTGSIVVGERGAGGVDLVIDPWPSDHRAVVSSFEVHPAPLPTFVTARPRVARSGEPLTVSFHIADPGADGHVAVVDRGGSVHAPLAEADVRRSHGETVFSTADLAGGAYDAVLAGSSGHEVSRFPFWVKGPNDAPAIETSRAGYEVGESVPVTWRWAPGNRWDWVAIVPRGGDPKTDVVVSRHTGTAIEDTAVFGADSEGGPLPAGEYTALLLVDDGWDALDAADFSVGS